jgi:hypothetical protein
MRSLARFVGELVLAFAALGSGLGVLWVASKIAPPVLLFLVRLGI